MVTFEILDGLDHIHTLGHTTKDSMLVIQPRGWHRGDEELGPVGRW